MGYWLDRILADSHNNLNRSKPWCFGVAMAIAVALASTGLSQLIGRYLLNVSSSPVSPIMLAILLGTVIANLNLVPESWRSGLNFCTKAVLQLGIVLLGFRLSLTSAGSIGLTALPLVLGCIATALLVVMTAGKLLGLPTRLTGLIAIGTSICGCTAIVAMAPLVRARDAEVSYAIAVVAIFGMLAMLTYPWLAHSLLDGRHMLSGFFLGTAIHDTAQVAGAALIYQQQFQAPEALDVATVTKLVRNLMMVVLIPLVAMIYRSGADTKGSASQLLPSFILAFAAMSALRTWGDMQLAGGQQALMIMDPEGWNQLTLVLGSAAKWLLAVAMAGVGLTTRLQVLRDLGLKPFLLGLTAALAVGLTSMISLVTLFT